MKQTKNKSFDYIIDSFFKNGNDLTNSQHNINWSIGQLETRKLILVAEYTGIKEKQERTGESFDKEKLLLLGKIEGLDKSINYLMTLRKELIINE